MGIGLGKARRSQTGNCIQTKHLMFTIQQARVCQDGMGRGGQFELHRASLRLPFGIKYDVARS